MVRTRAIAVLTAVAAGLSWLAMTSTASAQQSPIQHIVVLYLENHSFDNLLGFWCNDHPRRCPDGGMPTLVKLSNGAVVRPGVMPDIVPKVAHSVAAEQTAIHRGSMDGWQKVQGCTVQTGYACVGGYTPQQVPNLAALAKQFAISDRTFSMADSPSFGGHLYAVMAQLDGFLGNNPFPGRAFTPRSGWGCDSRHLAQWRPPNGGATVRVPSCVPDYRLAKRNGGAFERTPVQHAPTILDRLSAAHLSWRIYGEPKPSGNGTLAYGYVWDICPSFADCLYTHQKRNNVASSSFLADARSGNLPNFSIVTPGGQDSRFSEHNGFSITAGDNWLGQVASAVMHGPQWRHTVLFITWDDCGCLYDQVPPGVNPDGTAQGPRTPLIIVSPYAKRGYTDRTPSTFAGILAYTEHTFGLNPLTINDQKAYPFSNAFDYHQHRQQALRVVTRPLPPDAYHVDMRQAQQGS